VTEPGSVRDPAYARLAETVRIEGSRVLATLVRSVGSLQLAEDAVGEAVLAALTDWPRTGIPAQPRAWLTVTARRKAIDMLRREQARPGKEQESADLLELGSADPPPDSVLRDDQLRLIFTCCHPALPADGRIALALRILCGLSIPRIAAVMLSTEAATAKRLTRARTKVAAARIPYRVPDRADLPARLGPVCAVVHALYTAGHAPLDGPAVVDVDSCAEAIRLARLLHDLLPGEPMPQGLLALLLLTESRRAARTDAAGELVTLDSQDRAGWDAGLTTEGLALLAASLRRTGGVADPYQLQAAIAAEHARAPSYDRTDWAEVVRLYDLLLSVAPSQAAALSRAVALAEAAGPAAALSTVDALEPGPRRDAVRAELLARLGRYREAVAALDASLAGGAASGPERRYRLRRRAFWTEQDSVSGPR
jgi:RNA polymerase sigma factor (sigma-70 family)